jgi:hypothetical protein
MEKYIKCYDKFNQQLFEGDYVDVQKDGVHKIYKKEDGQLYFKPYGEEDMVCAYFSNDIAKCDIDGNWLNNDRYEDDDDDYSKILKATMVPKEYFGEDAAREYYRRGVGTPSLSVTSGLQEEPFSIRQETLEEAAERHYINCIPSDRHSFISGAKWQQEIHLDIKDNKIELLEEDLECIRMYLDDLKIPRTDKDGNEYSIVGRIKWQSERMYSEEQVLELLNKVMIKYSKYAQHFGEYVDTDAEIKMYLEQLKKK